MTAVSRPAAPVALYRGEDAFTIDQAVERLAIELGAPGPPLRRWRLDPADERAGSRGPGLDRAAEHVGTAPLFGGGELVVVGGLAGFTRERGSRERLLALVGSVPPGNGLVLIDVRERPIRRDAPPDALARAVVDSGGAVAEFPALTRERMVGWLTRQAAELGVRLGPGAAQVLSERIGAQVREGDVDRRHLGALAHGELAKLALYRPDDTITREDVAALVPETVPGSAWAFIDAVGERQAGLAATLAERLLVDGTPIAVLVARLHGRLRELLVAVDHLAAGARPPELARLMGLQAYRAQRLADQALAWSGLDLERALDGLIEVDLASKGIGADGGAVPTSEERSRLALATWLAERVARRGGASVRA